MAISGATGAIYVINLLNELNNASVETQLIVSNAAKKTIELETDYLPDDIEKMASHHFCYGDIALMSSNLLKYNNVETWANIPEIFLEGVDCMPAP